MIGSDNATGLIGLFFVLALLPFFLMMVTSFVKISVVLSLIRNAIGVQQIPPSMVINGLAILLSAVIMAPTAKKTYAIIQDMRAHSQIMSVDGTPEELKPGFYADVFEHAKVPITEFMLKHTTSPNRRFFMQTAGMLWPEEDRAGLTEDSLLVLIPSFTISELTSAFQIGFLIYLPFIVIDLIISNILLAMGMMMVSPMTISLPFKLLLFVLVNGWSRIIQGLVVTYQ